MSEHDPFGGSSATSNFDDLISVDDSDAVDNVEETTDSSPEDPDLEGLAPMAGTEETADEPAPQPEAPTTPQRLKFKMTIDGQEVEEEFDYEEAALLIQKSKAAGIKFQEAAQLKQQINQLLMAAKADPAQLFQYLGVDMTDYAERYLGERLERELMSPEELEQRRVQEELERYRAAERQQQEAIQRQQYEAQRLQAKEQLETSIREALEATDLPKDPKVRSMVMYEAMTMFAADKAKAIRNGTQPTLTPKRAIERVMDTNKRRLGELLQKMDDDALASFLGEDTLKRLRARDVKRTQKFPSNRNTAGQAPKHQTKKQDAPKTINEREFDNWLKDLK